MLMFTGGAGTAIGLLGAVSDQASAAGTCAAPSFSYTDGYTYTGGAEGFWDFINSQNSSLCRPVENGDYYAAWTMIAGAGYPTGYSQSGFMYRAGQPVSGNWVFAEADTNGTSLPQTAFYQASYAPSTVGGPYKFWTWPDPNGGMESGWSNNSESSVNALLVTNDNDYWAAPWQAEAYGETNHLQSDIPGVPSGPVDFKSPEFEINGTWSYGNYSSMVPGNNNPSQWFLRAPYSYSPDPDATDFSIYSYNP
ncbi:MAG: hypothetical protein ACRDVP_05530 [Acidimicrobiales bacterium]